MPTKKEIDRAIQICRGVITDWDPYSLIANGAPSDEFDSEILAVVGQLDRIRSRNDAVHAVSRVFSFAFEPEYFGFHACADVGATLFEQLVQAKLVVNE